MNESFYLWTLYIIFEISDVFRELINDCLLILKDFQDDLDMLEDFYFDEIDVLIQDPVLSRVVFGPDRKAFQYFPRDFVDLQDFSEDFAISKTSLKN